LLRICHKQASPVIVTSGGNEAFVRFDSDVESQRQGFRATYKMVMSSKFLSAITKKYFINYQLINCILYWKLKTKTFYYSL